MATKANRIVKVKAIKGIAEYLHNLTGPVLTSRKQPIIKRMPPHNNPKRIGTETEFLVDLSAHRCQEIDDSLSKRFWFKADMLLNVTYQIQLSKGHGKAAKGMKKTTTVLVVENLPKGCLIKKKFQFIIGNPVSKMKAMAKAKAWIKEHK